MGQSTTERRCPERNFHVLVFLLVIALQINVIQSQMEEIDESSGTVDTVPSHVVIPQPACSGEGIFGHPRECSWYYRCSKHEGQECYSRTYFSCSNGTVFCDVAKACVTPMEAVQSCNRTHATPLNPSPVNMYAENIINVGSLPTQSNIVILVNSKQSQSSLQGTVPLPRPTGCQNNTGQGSGNVYITIGNSESPTSIQLKPPPTGYVSQNQSGVICLNEKNATISPNGSFSVQCRLNNEECEEHDVCLPETTSVKLCSKSTVECKMLNMIFPICLNSALYNPATHECVYKKCPYEGNSTKVNLPLGTLPTVTVTDRPSTDTPTTSVPSAVDTGSPITTTDISHTTLTSVSPTILPSTETPTTQPTTSLQCLLSYEYCQNTNVCRQPEAPFEEMYVCKNAKFVCSNGTEMPLCLEDEMLHLLDNVCVSTNCMIPTTAKPSLTETTATDMTTMPFTTTSKMTSDTTTQTSTTSELPTNPTTESTTTQKSSSTIKITETSTSTPLSLLSTTSTSQIDGQECTLFYKYCRLTTVCDKTNTESQKYLCRESYSECGDDRERIEICENDQMYDPEEKECVLSTCPYSTSEPFIDTSTNYPQPTSTSFTTTDSSSTIPAEIPSSTKPDSETEPTTTTSPTTLLPTTPSPMLISSTEPVEPKPGDLPLTTQPSVNVTTSSSTTSLENQQQCTFYYKYCAEIIICDEDEVEDTTYLCRQAYSECGVDSIQVKTCLEGELYNPIQKTCVVSMCPYDEYNVGAMVTNNGSTSTTASVLTTSTPITETTRTSETPITIPTSSTSPTATNPSDERPTSTTNETPNFTTTTNEAAIIATSELPTDAVTEAPTTITTTSVTQTSTTTTSEAPTTTPTSEASTSTSAMPTSPTTNAPTATVPDETSQLTTTSTDSSTITTTDNNFTPTKTSPTTETFSTTITETSTIETTPSTTTTSEPSTSTHPTTEAPVTTEVTETTAHSGSETDGGFQTYQCTFYYRFCRYQTTCNDESIRGTQYLCNQSFSECGPNRIKIEACGKEQLYNPVEKHCVSSLCPYNSIAANIKEHAVVNETSSNISTDTTVSTTVSSTPSFTSPVTDGPSQPPVTDSLTDEGSSSYYITVKCTFFYKYCKTHLTCDDEGEESQTYLCRESYSECGHKMQRLDACNDGDLYNPNDKTCISSTCPYTSNEATIISSTTVEVTNTGSDVTTILTTTIHPDDIASTDESSESGSSEEDVDGSLITVQCTFYYKYCKITPTCDNDGIENSHYLCKQSYSECGPNKKRMNACTVYQLYNPRQRVCVENTCPYTIAEALIVNSTTIHSSISSISNNTESEVTQGTEFNITTISGETVGTDDGIDGSTSEEFSGSGEVTSSHLVTVQCTFFYKVCTDITTCDDNDNDITQFLCKEAFSECGPQKKRMNACNNGELYNPAKKECVKHICPYTTVAAVIISSSIMEVTGSTNETDSLTEGSEESIEVTLPSVETDQEETSFTTVECTFYYKYCKEMSTCDANGDSEDVYLCKESYSECGPTKKRLNTCSVGNLYDPDNRLCVSSLCPYTTSGAVIVSSTTIEMTPLLNQTTIEGTSEESPSTGGGIGTVSVTVPVDGSSGGETISESEEISGYPVTGSGETVLIFVKCTFFYKQCSIQNTCNTIGTSKEYYLCQEAYSECGPDKKKIETCANGEQYSPQEKQCVSSICPFVSSQAVIITSTLVETISTTVTNTSTIVTITNSTSTEFLETKPGESNTNETDQTVSNEETETEGDGFITKCTLYYRYCSVIETCDETGTTKKEYLCREAYSECGSDKEKKVICQNGELYNPRQRLCVSSVCPLEENAAIIITSSTNETSTDGPVLVPVSIETESSEQTDNEVVAVISNGTQTTVVTTGVGGGHTTTLITVQCTFYYKLCRNYATCDDKGNLNNMYLCNESYSECGPNRKRMDACKEGEMYNPRERKCVSSLCPYESYTAIIISTSTTNTTVTTTVSEEIGTTTVIESSSSVDGSSSTEIEEGTIDTETVITVQCTFFYKFCKNVATCDDDENEEMKYLCRESFSECGSDEKRMEACENGELYDPSSKECVSSICPYESYQATIISTTAVPTTEISSSSNESHSSEVGISSGEVFISSVCTLYYKVCSTVQTCDDLGNEKLEYLCRESYSECDSDERKFLVCRNGHFYNPKQRVCVTSTCPYLTTSANIVSSISEIEGSDSSSETSEAQSSGEGVSVSINVPSNEIEEDSTSSENLASTSFITVQCTFFYKYCKSVTTCDQTGASQAEYLCREGYSECGPNNKRMHACIEGDLYNPVKKECVKSVCPYIDYDATIVNSTLIDTTNIAMVNVSTAISSGPSTSVVSAIIPSITDSSGESSSSLTILQCVSYYKQCLHVPVCSSQGVESNEYLCREAYSECGDEKVRKETCVNDELYNPKARVCVRSLCPYTSYVVIFGNATSSEESSGEKETIDEEEEGDSSESGSSIEVSGTGTNVKCYLSYRLCRKYETCTTDNEEIQNLYLCKEAFSECRPQNISKSACPNDQLYNPQTRSCILSLCPLESVDAHIIKVFSHNSTLDTTNTVDGSSTGITSSSGTQTVTSTVDNSAITSTSQVSIKCYLSYSLCKNYDTCNNDVDTPDQTYLCKNAFSECNPGSLRQNACKDSTLFDPKSKQCVHSLCPLQTTQASIANASHVSLSAHMNLSNLTQSTYYQNVIVQTDVTKLPATTTNYSQFIVHDEQTSSHHLKFTCQFTYTLCAIENLCATSNMPQKEIILCKEATTNCSINSEISSLCPSGQPYSPERKRCVSSTCPYDESFIFIHFGSGIKINIEENEIKSQSIYTIIDSSPQNTDTANHLISSVSVGCTLSYQFCRNFSACSSDGQTKDLYLCREATETCDNNNEAKNLCKDSQLYNPQEHKCVSLICPLMWSDALGGANKSSTSPSFPTNPVTDSHSIENEVGGETEIIITKNRTKTILNMAGKRQVMPIHCQLDFTNCHYEQVCVDSIPESKIFCNATEVCFFKDQVISSTDYCAPEKLFDKERKECIDIINARKSCPPAILRDVTGGVNNLQVIEKFDSEESIFLREYEVQPLPHNLECSSANLRPYPNHMDESLCVKNVLCSIDGYIKIFKMRNVCDTYIQCVKDDTEWKVAEMECPDGLYYSFEENMCMAPALGRNCRFWTRRYTE